MRIGILGGSFDPVHLGHLILAEQCREQGSLDQVWFVPAPRPPHKRERHLARFDQRVEMLELALAGNPAFRVEEIERDRPGPSYTADTVTDLHERHAEHQFFLLLGSDTLAELHTWYAPRRLLEHAALMVMARPGHPVLDAEMLRRNLGLTDPSETPELPILLEVIEAPLLVSISSTDLRQRCQDGKTIRYLVPRAVECYIHEKGLYLVH